MSRWLHNVQVYHMLQIILLKVLAIDLLAFGRLLGLTLLLLLLPDRFIARFEAVVGVLPVLDRCWSFPHSLVLWLFILQFEHHLVVVLRQLVEAVFQLFRMLYRIYIVGWCSIAFCCSMTIFFTIQTIFSCLRCILNRHGSLL